jgi:cobalt/nickel transport system permease protein
MLLRTALSSLHAADRVAAHRAARGRGDPAAPHHGSLLYLLVAVSFGKYDFFGLAALAVPLLLYAAWRGVPVWPGTRAMALPVLFLLLVGAANPFFDRTPLAAFGRLAITGGMASLATLLLKGILCILAAHVLFGSIGTTGLGVGLAALRVPRPIVSVLVLCHRYLLVLLNETAAMREAHALRAPGARGIPPSAWGSFVGLLLLRSIDRSHEVHGAMLLRGFDGVLPLPRAVAASPGASAAHLALGAAILVFLRVVPVLTLVGNLACHA